MKLLKFFFFTLLSLLSNQEIACFKAAVFEHAEQSYATTGNPRDIIRHNLDYYEVAVNFAKSKGVEIMVFPEYGIFPPAGRKKLKNFLEYIPDPRIKTINPCAQPCIFSDRPILYSLSCLARENNIIIVADMGDIQPCKGDKSCPKDGSFHFNTAVAFGRDGQILAKYHKEHLFIEPGMDLPKVQQDPTFQTDLGRFAMFVCFDIVFQRTVEVGHWNGVKAVLLPTMWVNSSPMFSSIQYFEAWAHGNNVTLLAANVQLPGLSGIGSGIMKGSEGAQVYTFNPDGNSKLLIADISNSKSNSSIYIINKTDVKEWTDDGIDVGSECSSKILRPAKNVYRDYRCLERDTSVITLQKLTKTSDKIEACHNGMCCTLCYSADKIVEDFYFGVFNGTFNASNRYFFAEENCFLARCDGIADKSCATFPMRSETVFYNVFINSNFSTNSIYPTVMESGMRLTPTAQWLYKTKDNVASVSLKSPSGKKLLTVSLKARAYERDPPYVR